MKFDSKKSAIMPVQYLLVSENLKETNDAVLSFHEEA